MFASCRVGEECVSPGLYAIAGAASALAGVTRLTGTYTQRETPAKPHLFRFGKRGWVCVKDEADG